MVAAIIHGKALELRVVGRTNEDLGSLLASAELTAKLSSSFPGEMLLAEANNTLVDRSPVDEKLEL